ncbi:PD-(D/E)XK nuclease-like domain-containing protein [Rhodococcus spongiicola]|uniref:RecE n=1 Tax=Rhodococcus spongiicola TaxID=2487352 RepID=A0A438B5M9_9NOCA|nr:PD-(D/E)XK nuclease-like domain-containing protein [Rhodococcus spongiicola]RVW06250.1 recE [Rhodococcus spongiicola]
MSDIVDAEGLYADIPDHVYHSDKNSLSSSGARALLASPARYRYRLDHPPEPKDHFDFGHAAHSLILGVGAELVRIDADEWRTKAIKDVVAAVRAEGKVPLKPADYDTVHAMADQLCTHPIAAMLFRDGQAELSGFWRDDHTGMWLRVRPDWLPTQGSGRQIIVDYKTTTSADPKHFAKAAYDYGYHQQAPWYIDGLTALGLGDDPAFVFVAQEKTAPYLVSVIELDDDAVALGRQRNREAIDLYAHCQATDTWPDYGQDVHRVSLPAYAFK